MLMPGLESTFSALEFFRHNTNHDMITKYGHLLNHLKSVHLLWKILLSLSKRKHTRISRSSPPTLDPPPLDLLPPPDPPPPLLLRI